MARAAFVGDHHRRTDSTVFPEMNVGSITPSAPPLSRSEGLNSPADSRGPDMDQHFPLARLHIRLPHHVDLLLGIIRASKVDVLVPLLDVFVDFLLREDLEVWVVEDFGGVVLPHKGFLRVVSDGVEDGLVDGHFGEGTVASAVMLL